MNLFAKFALLAYFFLGLESQSKAQLTTGFTFSRQYGQTNSSTSSTTVLGSSRVLGESCKGQIRGFYVKNNIKDPNTQGCIVSPVNVISMPAQTGKYDQFKIKDTSQPFSVGNSISSKAIDNLSNNKSIRNFSSYGYSVFTVP